MLLQMLATLVMCAPVEPDRAADRDLPADIERDVARVAARLHELVTSHWLNDGDVRREALWLALDLRYHAMRCTLRGVAAEEAKRLTELARVLEQPDATREELSAARSELVEVTGSRNLRWMLMSLIERQDRIAREIWRMRREYSPDYDQGRTDPAIGELPLIVLKVGKSVRVRQSIQWRQYPHDTLKVTLVSSAAELVAPAELTLEFEKHSLDFEYEIRGLAEGDYTLVLVPALGQEVNVSVSVR